MDAITQSYGDDVTRRAPRMSISQRPPANLSNQIFWWRVNLQNQYNLPGSTPPNEVNFVTMLNQYPQYSNLTTVFDQYCIHSITATWTMGVGTSSGNIIIHSAIDYDNVVALGNLSQLQPYSSHHVSMLTSAGASVTRYYEPCIAPLAVSSSLPLPALIARSWIDCGFPDVQHYGLRTMYEVSSGSTNTINLEFNIVVGFRNVI